MERARKYARNAAMVVLGTTLALACSPDSTTPRSKAIDPGALVHAASSPDGDQTRRLEAIRALGTLNAHTEQIAPALRSLLADPDPDIAGHAKIALRRVQGQGALSFARPVVIGASVSAGFLGTPLGTVLDKSLAGAHEIKSVANTYFFRAPIKNGRAHVKAAQDFDASVVFAVDYLFWFVYVSGANLDERMDRLDTALDNLESLKGPVIVGDIPDMRTAKAWMLPAEVVPPAEQLARLNQHVHDWARDKVNVHVVPLARWSEPLLKGKDVIQSGTTFTAKQLLSFDGLHLNPRGVRYLMRNIDAELERAFPDTPKDILRVAE